MIPGFFTLLSTFLPSRTLGLVTLLVPLVGRLIEKSYPVEWLYQKLPESTRKKISLEEVKVPVDHLKEAIQETWKLLHKDEA